jgi:hypothetical protein
MTRPPLSWAIVASSAAAQGVRALGHLRAAIPALLAFLVLLAPLAAAHGPGPAMDQDARLLADHNDDCGGDDVGALSSCRGTHDLVSLDVRELHEGGSDLVVFRFLLNGGNAADGLRDVLSLKADGAAKTFEIRTTNNQDFQGTGFTSVSKALPTGDGTRFIVEATVRRDSLGPVGAKLTEFKVEAFRGSTSGDYMPGGYHGPVGQVSDPDQSPPTNRVAGCLRPGTQQIEQAHCYRLRGPGYYVALDDPGSQQVPADGEVLVVLQLRNQLPNTAQALTVTATAADGVRARFHDPASGGGEGYAAELRIDLPKGGSTSSHLALDQATAGASGAVTVTVTTDLGGRLQLAVPFEVVTGAAPNPTPTAGDGDADNGGGGRFGAPGPGPALALLALATAAWAARRRA